MKKCRDISFVTLILFVYGELERCCVTLYMWCCVTHTGIEGAVLPFSSPTIQSSRVSSQGSRVLSRGPGVFHSQGLWVLSRGSRVLAQGPWVYPSHVHEVLASSPQVSSVFLAVSNVDVVGF